MCIRAFNIQRESDEELIKIKGSAKGGAGISTPQQKQKNYSTKKYKHL